MRATPSPALLPYLQEFQGEGIQAEGVLYPSPASRFGARDSGQSPVTRFPTSSVSNDIPGSTVSSHFSTRGTSQHPIGAHRVGLPYFAHLDQQGYPRERRQPRQVSAGGNSGGDRGGTDGFDFRVAAKISEAGPLHPSTKRYGHGEWTATDVDDVTIKDGAVTDERKEPCGSVEGGGCATEAPGVRSETINRLQLPRPPLFEPTHSPQMAKRETFVSVERGGSSGRWWQGSGSQPSGGWLRYLPGVGQEMRSDEGLDPGESDVGGGENALSLSRLFAYAFPDNDRHLGRLLEPTREINSHQGEVLSEVGGVRSTCSPRLKGAAGANVVSRLVPSSSPRAPPRDSVVAGTTNNKTLVGVTVRRPPSPQFLFMAECSLDASISPATSRQQRHPLIEQQQVAQKTSYVKVVDQRASDVQQRIMPSRGPFDETPINDYTALRSGGHSPLSRASWIASSSGSGLPVRAPPRSRKRRHPVSLTASRAVAVRDSPSLPLAIDCVEATVQKRPSAGDHDGGSLDREGSVEFGDGRLGRTYVRGRARSGRWGAKGGDTAVSSGDEAAIHALRPFQMDDDAAGFGGHEASWDDANRLHDIVQNNVGRVAATARYKGAGAVDSKRSEEPGARSEDTKVTCDSKASTRSAGGSMRTPSAAGGDQICHAEVDGKMGVGDRSKKFRICAAGAALAYDQDALGGDGLAQDSFVEFEPETVADVLGHMATEECDRWEILDYILWCSHRQ